MGKTRDPITGREFTNGAATDWAPGVEIQKAGGYTYIGEASPPGTAYASRAAYLAAEIWRVQRIEDATGSVDLADGDANFDNAATAMNGLSYLA